MHSTFLCFFIAIAACFNTLQAHEEIDIKTKVYVEASNIYINEAGIFLVIEQHLIPVEAIGRDEAGLYALNPELVAGDWVCSRCETVNNVGNRKCTRCGLWR